MIIQSILSYGGVVTIISTALNMCFPRDLSKPVVLYRVIIPVTQVYYKN